MLEPSSHFVGRNIPSSFSSQWGSHSYFNSEIYACPRFSADPTKILSRQWQNISVNEHQKWRKNLQFPVLTSFSSDRLIPASFIVYIKATRLNIDKLCIRKQRKCLFVAFESCIWYHKDWFCSESGHNNREIFTSSPTPVKAQNFFSWCSRVCVLL